MHLFEWRSGGTLFPLGVQMQKFILAYCFFFLSFAGAEDARIEVFKVNDHVYRSEIHAYGMVVMNNVFVIADDGVTLERLRKSPTRRLRA